MRSRVVRALRPLDAVAVENPAGPGTPDVNYVEGWLELKWARRWPKRGGMLEMEHFTPQQRVWLTRRWRAGGNAHLLLQVRREWLLFRGDVAANVVGHADRAMLIAAATAHWQSGLRDQELVECLQKT